MTSIIYPDGEVDDCIISEEWAHDEARRESRPSRLDPEVGGRTIIVQDDDGAVTFYENGEAVSRNGRPL